MGKKVDYRIELNSLSNLQNLLQESYDITTEQINSAQQEMNKLTASTDLKEELMDGKAKYSKALHDFMTDKDRALSRRIEIAKLMAEVIKEHGNSKRAFDEIEGENAFNVDVNSLNELLRNSPKETPKKERLY